MSSVSGLIVPNNFKIGGAALVTADSVTTFTNKTLTDPSNVVVATGLFTGSGSGDVDVGAAAAPTAGQVLTAVDANNANWQDPEVTINNNVALVNKDLSAASNIVNASGLFASSGGNVIDIGASPNPSAGDVLKATSFNTAEWQTDAGPGKIFRANFGPVFGAAGADYTAYAFDFTGFGDGIYTVDAEMTVRDDSGGLTSGSNGGFRCVRTLTISGGAIQLQGGPFAYVEVYGAQAASNRPDWIIDGGNPLILNLTLGYGTINTTAQGVVSYRFQA